MPEQPSRIRKLSSTSDPCIIMRILTDLGLCRRHLVRLWLRDPEHEWVKPVALQERFDRVYDGVTVEKSVFPLEATIRSSNVAT